MDVCERNPRVHTSAGLPSRMSNVTGMSGVVKDNPRNKIQSMQVEQANTFDLSHDQHSKLNNFFIKHLQPLGVAQIMIGLQCLIFGIIESIFTLSSDCWSMLFCFYLGYPLWATTVFIISGSLTIVAVKKHTKPLIAVHIGANILSMILSFTGIILLSMNLINTLLFECPEFYVCPLVKSFATSNVIFQMIVTCVQFAISFLLSGLTYSVNGNELSWVSALSCLIRSDSEDPYQDLLTRPEDYEKIAMQDIELVDQDP